MELTHPIDPLRRRFPGALLRRGEEGYDEAAGCGTARSTATRRWWRAAPVPTTSPPSVSFARERDLPVSVKGGGHAVAGDAICDDGIVIDLSRMNRVEVDPRARTARGAGGALWSDLDRATQTYGLATTGGIVSTPGSAGSPSAVGWTISCAGTA